MQFEMCHAHNKSADLNVKPFGLDDCSDGVVSPKASISFKWEIISGAHQKKSSKVVTGTDVCSDNGPCVTNYGRNLIIPPFWLPLCHGSSEVIVTTTQNMGDEAKYVSVPVLTHLPLQPLVPAVEVSIKNIADEVGFGDAVVLDASGSKDLGRRVKQGNGFLEFRWTCYNSTKNLCLDTDSKPLRLDGAQKLKFVPSRLGLVQGSRYSFKATVTAPLICVAISPTEVCSSQVTTGCLEACLHLLHCIYHPRELSLEGCDNPVAIAACAILNATYPPGPLGGSVNSTSPKILTPGSTQLLSFSEDSVLSACSTNGNGMSPLRTPVTTLFHPLDADPFA